MFLPLFLFSMVLFRVYGILHVLSRFASSLAFTPRFLIAICRLQLPNF